MPRTKFVARPSFTATNFGFKLPSDVIPSGEKPPKPTLNEREHEWLWLFSGGGTKGSFEAGVALYLEQVLPAPREIHGSSTGSLTALKMAEGERTSGTSSANQLVELYRELRLWSDMYDAAPSYLTLREAVNQARKEGLPIPAVTRSPGATYGVYSAYDRTRPVGPTDSSPADDILPDDLFGDETSLRFMTSGAIAGAALLLGPFATGIGIGLAIHELLTGNISGKLSAINDLEDALLEYEQHGQSVAVPTPLRAILERAVDFGRVRQSGIRLRLQTVRLSDGTPMWMTERSSLVDADGVHSTVRSDGDALVNGALASAAIPGFFPPVFMEFDEQADGRDAVRKGDLFVDGGVRDIMPIELVEGFLTRPRPVGKPPAVVGVTASPVENRIKDADWTKQPTGGNVADVLGRSLEITVDEVFRSDISELRRLTDQHDVPYVEIAPTFEVLSTIDVDPGLIAINIDYGYMRAFDAFWEDVFRSTRARELSDKITRKRMHAWRLERRHLRCRVRRENQFDTGEPAVGFFPNGVRRPVSASTFEDFNALGVSPGITFGNVAWARRSYKRFRSSAHNLFRVIGDDRARLNEDIERKWASDGRDPDDIIVWDRGVVELLRETKVEINELRATRLKEFGASSMPARAIEWALKFEDHVDEEDRHPNNPNPRTLLSESFNDFPGYSPWSRHFDIGGVEIPAIEGP